jgi:DNA (cytosine-5)-methyltransferase 1
LQRSQTPAVAIRTAQTSANGHGVSQEAAHTLDGANGQAVAFKASHYTRDKDGRAAESGGTISADADRGDQDPIILAPTLSASNNPSRSPQSAEVTAQVAAAYAETMRVRRLTPRECERLMSWPDDWTAVGVKENGKSYRLADGPRYRLCGNGIASVSLVWLFDQLNLALAAEEAS